MNLSRVAFEIPLAENQETTCSFNRIFFKTSCGGFSYFFLSDFLSKDLTFPFHPQLWQLYSPVSMFTESDLSALFFLPSWHLGHLHFSLPLCLVSLISKS